MKTLKSIFAILLLTSFLASCTPTSLTEDNPNTPEQFATGDDGADDTDDSRDGSN